MPSEAFAGLIGVYKVSGCSGALRAPVLGCCTPERDILKLGRRCSKAVHSAPSPDGASPENPYGDAQYALSWPTNRVGLLVSETPAASGAQRGLQVTSGPEQPPTDSDPSCFLCSPPPTLLPPFSLMIFLKLCRRWQLPSHPTWDRGNVLAPCTRVWKHSFHLCSRPALKGPNHTHFTLEPQRGKIFYFFQNKLLPIQIAI